MTTWVREQADSVMARPCARPPLRGEAVKGLAMLDQRAVLEGAPDTRACLDHLHQLSAADPKWHKALFQPPTPVDRATIQRKWSTVRAPTPDALSHVPDPGAVCQVLLSRMHKAVSFVGACSPYRPGVGCAPELDIRLQVAQLTAVVAWRTFAQGSHCAAFDLLLDGMRFQQDLINGGVTWAEVEQALRAMDIMVPVAEALLNAPTAIKPDLLLRVEQELGLLMDSQPHPVSVLLAQYLHLALSRFLPRIQKDQKLPAAGGPCQVPQNDSLSSLNLKPADRAALGLVALDRSFRESALVCRPDRSPRKCQEGLKRLHAKYQSVLKKDPQAYVRMQLGHLVRPEHLAGLRNGASVILKTLGPQNGDAVARQGQMLFSFSALRFLAAIRAERERTGQCPDLQSMRAGHLAEMRTDPYAHVPLSVLYLGPGRYAMGSQVDLEPGAGPAGQPALVFNCPGL